MKYLLEIDSFIPAMYLKGHHPGLIDDMYISFTLDFEEAKKYHNEIYAQNICDALNKKQSLQFSLTNEKVAMECRTPDPHPEEAINFESVEVKHSSKSLSEDDIKQKDEFIESQNNIPCKDCEIGLRERSVDGCAGCTNDEETLKVLNCQHCEHHNKTYNTKIYLACIEKHKLNKQTKPHNIMICIDCNHYGNPHRCPQRDPDHVSCPAAIPLIEKPCCDNPSKERCEQCQETGLANPLNQG
jgi:hypothetical protein